GRVSYLNPVAEQLTGWTSAEASGRPLEEVFRIVDEESRKTAENPVIKVLREGQTVGLANHTVLIAKDGREIAIDDSAAPIRDAHGAMVGVVLIFRDITDRRRMERQLHKSAERLEAALDAGSMGVWDWDIASGKVTWSPNLEAIHGIDRGSFGGTFEAFLSDVHPDHLASVKQSISRSLDAKSDHDIEYRIVVPGGSVHWIHGKGRVVVDAAGNPIGMTGLCMDISGRKHAEEDLRRRAEEIQALVDATPAFVWFGHDAQCSRITGNQAANRLLGTAPGANLSQTPGDGSAIAIKHFAPDGHEIPPDQLPMQTAVATRQPVANTELEIRFGDGRGVHLLGNATPLFDISGEVRGCVAAFVDITERKQAEQQFHLAVEAAPNGMVVADADGEIVLVNASTERMFGYTREELIGRPVELLVPERFRNSHQRDRHNFLSGPEVRPMGAGRDLHGRRKDGSEFPVEIGLNPIQTEGGTLVLGSIIDITERRDAEVTRHLLASVVESSVDAVITKDLNGRVTSWNRGAERMFGYSAEQMIGQTISVIVPPAHTEETFEALERVKRGEAIAQHETVRQTKDGATIVVSVTWSPIRDDRGRIVGASKVVRDITERKKAEDALRQSEERLATVMKHLPVGVGVVDRDGHVVIGNPSWKQFLRGDIPSVDPAEGARWRAMTPDGQPLAPSEYPGLRALRGEDVLPGIDFLRKEDDGEERWTRVSAVPLRDKTGQITGALVMLQDIDEERRAQAQRAELLAKERALETEKALREMESELARVTRALSVGELATSIAHEVNQPLAGVVTNAEAALRWLSGETPDIQEAKESLALIGRDANRAAAVIKRIREFLKKEGPQTVPLKVNDVIQEAVELARAEFAKRGISLRMNLSTDIPHVYGDRIQLQQVVLNLMMNAAEAMASTQDAKELLLLSEKSPDGVVLLAVRDHGAGLSAEDMPRMFDAFFTTKPAGMGMGLSISRSIVESHGGRIWAECNDGPGLTVRLALPAGNDGS
ncbi:MAG: PAS domain S-box protein, partial [Acidobacteria bacterium]|nr:PAS domain S-box protein [Acidobacteriota bacterium]